MPNRFKSRAIAISLLKKYVFKFTNDSVSLNNNYFFPRNWIFEPTRLCTESRYS